MSAGDDSQLEDQDIFLPIFELPSTAGKPVGPKAFRQRRNLVLVLLHQAQCRSCQRLLKIVIDNYTSFASLNAEVLAVIVGDPKTSLDLYHEIHPPFPFLFDNDDAIAALCLGGDRFHRPAILVADRYGALWGQSVANREDGTIDIGPILELLEFIEIQCPECGVMDSPPPSRLL